ncbi:HAD-IB family phosphatase [Litorimonas sp. WD9-15]|uniref:HAD-IB family phosphatase n=1 Tax=Litorimonas sp. WD9-15 TaxID=3418716 RepID=UPI003D033A28
MELPDVLGLYKGQDPRRLELCVRFPQPIIDRDEKAQMSESPTNVVSQKNADHEIVAFDFDGTITTKDTFALFLRYYAGTPRWLGNIARLMPTFISYKLGRIDRHAVKAAVVHRFFAGRSIERIESMAESFARDVIPRYIRPAALAHVKAKLADANIGPDSLYMCSASIGPYLRYWARSTGIHPAHVMATELESDGATASGGLKGYNVWGANKVRRIFDQFAPQSVKILEAYGDTRGDWEMLHAAEASYFRPFRVSPISN